MPRGVGEDVQRLARVSRAVVHQGGSELLGSLQGGEPATAEPRLASVRIKTAGGQEVVAKSVNLIVQDGRIVSHAPPAPRQDVPADLARVR